MPERPLEESLRAFCGEGWLSESATLSRSGADVIGVASCYGPPFVFAGDGLFMIADTVAADASAVRGRGAGNVAFEADEANAELWQLLDELPTQSERGLLLLST